MGVQINSAGWLDLDNARHRVQLGVDAEEESVVLTVSANVFVGRSMGIIKFLEKSRTNTKNGILKDT